MTKSFTVVVFSGEVRSRIKMTARCLSSINSQSYTNLQKILINAGAPPHQTSELEQMGIDLTDWEVLDFPTDCMDMDNNWSIHRWNGAAALHVTKGEFFFALNDDDFLAPDFFLRMNALFNEYPGADSAMGLRVTYNHETDSFGEIRHPMNLEGEYRPKCEPGINLVRELFFRNNLGYGPSLGFQPILRTSLVQELGPDFFYRGFYSDCAPYFQIVCRSDTLFDPNAHMYWGIHGQQDHTKWDLNNFWKCKHEEIFKNFMEHNIAIFNGIFPCNRRDTKEIKTYFNKRITSVSIFALSTRYLAFKSPLSFFSQIKSEQPNSFPTLKHVKVVLKRPVILIKIVYQTLKDKWKLTA